MQKQFSTRSSSSSRMSRRYEQPTIASKSRSPSPYTNRRMCELTEDSRQRLAHLNLGPYKFKKEYCNPPPFVVRHIETTSIPDTSELSFSSSSLRSEESSRQHTDTSVVDSFRPRGSRDSSKMHIDDLQMSLDNVSNIKCQESSCRASSLLSRSAPPSVLRHPPSPVLHRSSLRERFQTDPRTSINWKETHERVRSIVRSNSARQKLCYNKNVSWKDPAYSDTMNEESFSTRELQDSLSFPQDKCVHLDNGEFWCNRAAAYKGKSHRIIFEESMEKIYKNMYRNATNPNAYRESHDSKDLI